MLNDISNYTICIDYIKTLNNIPTRMYENGL